MSDETMMRYADLLDEALTRIPALAPGWTDHNPSDPGIALLELAAWLTETVLYRSTRIDDRSRRALLALIEGTDPVDDLSGEALDARIRSAIKELRRPYRAVTAQDYLARLREDWPLSDAAKALGLESRIAAMKVMARRNLESATMWADAPAHMSVVVVPARSSWVYPATLRIDRPEFIVAQPTPGSFEVQVPRGGRLFVTGAVNDALLFDEVVEAGATPTVPVTANDIGETGSMRVTVDQANTVSGFTIGGPEGVAGRRVTATDGTLLGSLFLPARRSGYAEVVVTTASDVPLKLEMRRPNGGLAQSVEGVGVLALPAVGFSSWWDKDELQSFPVRLFAPEAEAGTEVDVTWHVQIVETPRAWNAGGDHLLDAVWDFLEPRRLLATRHHITMVRYVVVALDVDIYLTDDVDEEIVRPRVVDALIRHFAPPGHAQPGHTSRPIGQHLTYTEIVACIEGVTGVDYVENLAVTTPTDRYMTDEGEIYGLTMAQDMVPDLQIARCNFNLFERA